MFQTCLNRRRGNALVLSVLILMSLTGLGVIAVQRSNTDLLVSSNLVRSTQASLAGDAGGTHGVKLMGMFINRYMAAAAQAGIVNPRIPLVTMGAGTNNIASCIPHVNPSHPAQQERALAQQEAAYSVIAWPRKPVQGKAGYSIDSDICFTMIDFDIPSGLVGNASSTQVIESEICADETQNCTTNTVVVKSRIRVLAGPTPCY